MSADSTRKLKRKISPVEETQAVKFIAQELGDNAKLVKKIIQRVLNMPEEFKDRLLAELLLETTNVTSATKMLPPIESAHCILCHKKFDKTANCKNSCVVKHTGSGNGFPRGQCPRCRDWDCSDHDSCAYCEEAISNDGGECIKGHCSDLDDLPDEYLEHNENDLKSCDICRKLLASTLSLRLSEMDGE